MPCNLCDLCTFVRPSCGPIAFHRYSALMYRFMWWPRCSYRIGVICPCLGDSFTGSFKKNRATYHFNLTEQRTLWKILAVRDSESQPLQVILAKESSPFSSRWEQQRCSEAPASCMRVFLPQRVTLWWEQTHRPRTALGTFMVQPTVQHYLVLSRFPCNTFPDGLYTVKVYCSLLLVCSLSSQ